MHLSKSTICSSTATCQLAKIRLALAGAPLRWVSRAAIPVHRSPVIDAGLPSVVRYSPRWLRAAKTSDEWGSCSRVLELSRAGSIEHRRHLALWVAMLCDGRDELLCLICHIAEFRHHYTGINRA